MFKNLNPKNLFLFDAVGALVSAFMLGVVLIRFEMFFGIPKNTLYFLAIVPCFFALYDFYWYRSKRKDINRFLIGIACANLLYCVLSIGMAFFHIEKITRYGWIYIIAEIVIIISLAVVEFRVGRKIKQ